MQPSSTSPPIEVSGTTFPAIRQISITNHVVQDLENFEGGAVLVAKGKSHLSYVFLAVCSSVLYLPPHVDNRAMLFQWHGENPNQMDKSGERLGQGENLSPMALEICYHKPARAQDFQWATSTFIQKNLRNLDQPPSDAIHKELSRFNSLYRSVSSGDRYLLEYIPAHGITLFWNEEALGTIGQVDDSNHDSLKSMKEQYELASLIYSIWFGIEPFSESMKRELLTPLDIPVTIIRSKPHFRNTESTASTITENDESYALDAMDNLSVEHHYSGKDRNTSSSSDDQGKLHDTLGFLHLLDESKCFITNSYSDPFNFTNNNNESSHEYMDLSINDNLLFLPLKSVDNNLFPIWTRTQKNLYPQCSLCESTPVTTHKINVTVASSIHQPDSLNKLNNITDAKDNFPKENCCDSNSNISNILFGIGGAMFLLPHLAILLSIPPVLQRRGAPYLPTFGNKMNIMFQMIRNHISTQPKSKLNFVDLGSGDGRVVFRAAQEGVFNVSAGYELNPALHIFAQLRRVLTPKYWSTTKFYLRDLWSTPLNNYDVVAVYGLAPIMERLGKKMAQELKPGSIVVSNVFEIPGWKVSSVEKEGDRRGVYVYRIPECFSKSEK